MTVIILVIVFFSVWAPVLSSRLLGIDTQALVLIAASIYGIFRNRTSTPLPIKYAMRVLYLFLAYVLVIYCVQLVVNGGAINTFALMRPIRSIITVYGCYSIAGILSEQKTERIGMIEMVFFSIVLHGVIVVTQVISPEFQDFIYSITNAGDLSEDRPWFREYRLAGLAGAGGSMTSMFHGFGILLMPLIFSREKYGALLGVGSAICACVLLVAIVFTGRLGLFLIALGFLLMLVLPWIWPSLTNAVIRSRAKGWSIGILAFAAVTYMVMLFAFGELSVVERAIFRVESGFDYQASGIDVLFSDFLILPEWEHLLIGDLHALSNTGFDRTFDTDIGYLVLLNGYGIVGSLLIYAFYAVVINCTTSRGGVNNNPIAVSHRRMYYNNEGAALALASVIFAVLILFANYKEPCALSRIGLSISGLLFSSWAINRQQNDSQRTSVYRVVK